MRRLKIIFICKLTICLLTWSVFVTELDALRGSAVVLQAKAKADKKNSEPEEVIELDENGEQVVLNVTTTPKPTLTGIPQIDYVHDPNLPRELNGYNLTDYPFLNSVPEEIDFKCDGLHDGFYASVPHKCQLYHHCLFGTRFDFLCANYTAFDQKTFICHFVSQVDCPNSAKYFNRNEALYKTAETTTLSTTTSSTTTTPAPPPPPPPPQQQQQQQQFQQQQFYPQYQQQQQQMPYEGRRAMPPGFAQGRKRRPAYRRRRPVYEYYYVDDYDDQQEYYDDSVEQVPMPKKTIRKHSRFNNYKPTDLEVDYQESSSESDSPLQNGGNNLRNKNNRGTDVGQQPQQQQQQQQQQRQQQQRQQTTTKNVSNQIVSVYDKPRAPPKIRRPVPINERDRYDYMSPSKQGQPGPVAVAASTTTTTTTEAPAPTNAAAPSRGKDQRPVQQPEEPIEYYDDEEEEEYVVEPMVQAAVKPAAIRPAATKPEPPVKPTVKASARTAVVMAADYDTDRGRRPSSSSSAAAVVRPKANNRGSPVVPVVQTAAAPRKRPTADRVTADEYVDEQPAAATKQSIAAATKQRTSGGPFLSRPVKVRPSSPAASVAPVEVVQDEAEEEVEVEEEERVYQRQQPRQSQRVSVRQATPARHNRPQQQSVADHPQTQYNNNKQIRAAATNNRRPMRPVYEYVDEYYDE